jgi:hypothetical protein
MEIIYRYAESTVIPNAIEICGDTVYLRKDILKFNREDDQGNQIPYWSYQEAKFTIEEFNKYANVILVSGQKSDDNDRLAIMEAIADLYETIATMTT